MTRSEDDLGDLEARDGATRVRARDSTWLAEGARLLLADLRAHPAHTRPMVPSEPMDDFELLDAWRAGSREAGSELFERHFPGLFWFFRNKAGESAEDLVQQTFLSVVESRDRFRKDASFRTYLFTVARSKLYDFVERHARRGDAVDIDAMSVQDLGLSPTADLANGEQQRILLHALRRLPLGLQVVLELYYFERIRGAEMAEVLGIPHGTVRSRVRRALEQLRERLAELEQSPEGVETTMSNLDDWAQLLRKAALRPADGGSPAGT